MIVERLELVDFRNYVAATFQLTAGTTVVVGDNGHGKTNLAEALAYLATLSSFRGAPPEALVRTGCTSAVLRAEVRDDDGRASLIEAELVPAGRNRVQVNRQRLERARDLLGVVRVTVFSPDDLTLVKGGPADRRRFLDDTLVALAVKYDAARLELDRIVRQRNTLLRQVGGRLDEDATTTLDVWDARLRRRGRAVRPGRATAWSSGSRPFVVEAYDQLAGRPTDVGLVYDPPWRHTGLAAALAAARDADLRRGVSTVGPHRDEVALIDRRAAGAHTRLAGRAAHAGPRPAPRRPSAGGRAHRLDAGARARRRAVRARPRSGARRCCATCPPGQVVITTASAVPPSAKPDRVLRIVDGTVSVDGASSPARWPRDRRSRDWAQFVAD